MVSLPDAAIFGGAVGLAIAMFGVLTISAEKRPSEYTPLLLAGFGGAAVGSTSLSLLSPLSLETNAIVGGGVGLFVGLSSSVMKQYFAPVRLGPACTVAIIGTVLFAGVGPLVGNTIGWTAAGAISLPSVAILAQCLRRGSAELVDESNQPVQVIPRREMCWITARHSWSLCNPLAWGWNGLLAGLLASLWGSWVTDQPDVSAARWLFLVCGGLAAGAIVLARLRILKRPANPS